VNSASAQATNRDFQRRGEELVLLLVGGDKRTQSADILRAIQIAADWKTDAEEK